jgi:hypothetical protein
VSKVCSQSKKARCYQWAFFLKAYELIGRANCSDVGPNGVSMLDGPASRRVRAGAEWLGVPRFRITQARRAIGKG